MLFNSVEYLLFFIVAIVLYWSLANKKLVFQNTLLLIASYVFYGWWDYRLLNFSFRPYGISIEDTQGEPYIYFDKLSVKNLPDFYSDGSSYDIITWYIDKMQPTEKNLFHNVKNILPINYKGYNISAIKGSLPFPKNILHYLMTSLAMQIKALLDLFSGNMVVCNVNQ